jgi:hypothetical protein
MTTQQDGPPPAPRWVKVFGILAVVAIAIFAAVHLSGGGFRDHMSHGSSTP